MFTTAPIEEVKKAIKDLEHTYGAKSASGEAHTSTVLQEQNAAEDGADGAHYDLQDAKKTLASLQLEN